MNEEELKQIWRKEEAIPLKNIDMEFIQKYTDDTQNILQRISTKETILGIIVAAIVALDFIYSGYFYFVLSGIVLLSGCVIWQIRRDKKTDRVRMQENIRTYLVYKEKSIIRNVRIMRVSFCAGILSAPLISRVQNGTFAFVTINPLLYITALIIGLLIVLVFAEFYIRRNYYPILEDLRYLIEELDGKNDNIV